MENDNGTRVYRDDQGQLVQVGWYHYRWTGTPDLVVGEKVILPAYKGNDIPDGLTEMTGWVKRLGSTYDGGHVNILRRA